MTSRSHPVANRPKTRPTTRPKTGVTTHLRALASTHKSAGLSLASQTAEMALAVPQVVAHRVGRMAAAGPQPSARDRKEFKRMVSEKGTAFSESWLAMGLQAVRANQALALNLVGAWWAGSGVFRGPHSALGLMAQMQRAGLGILEQGLKPLHREAVANARRLKREGAR